MNQKQTAQVLANFYVLTHLAVSKISGKNRWISAGNRLWHELRKDQFETFNRIIDDQTQLLATMARNTRGVNEARTMVSSSARLSIQQTKGVN